MAYRCPFSVCPHLLLPGLVRSITPTLIALNGITDNVTKIQRHRSSTKFYSLINQNTVINNKIKKYKFLIESTQNSSRYYNIEKQNSWSQNAILKSERG